MTGATGFTGGHLAATLAARGDEVRALVRPKSRARFDRIAAARPRRVRPWKAISPIPSSLAPRRRWRRGRVSHRGDLSRSRAARLGVSRRQCRGHAQRAAGRHATRAFSASCTAAPAACTGTSPIRRRTKRRRSIRETCIRRPSSKPRRRRATSALARGLDVVVVRPIGIYGPGDTRFLRMFRGLARGRFPLLGSGQAFYHLTFIDDLIEGIRLSGTVPGAAGRTYILAGPRYTTLEALIGLVAKELGVEPPRWHWPVWPFWTAGLLCEVVCVPLRIEPPLYRRRVDFYTKSRAFDTTRARTELGFHPSRRSGRGHPADGGVVSRAGTAVSTASGHPAAGRREAAEHRPHLRPPRVGRVAHARREAAVRVDDPAIRPVALQRLADQPAPQGPVRGHARAVRHRRHLPGAAQVRSRDLHGAAEGAAGQAAPTCVHMHGYGATTFGRLCAWRLGIPSILHEHANHTDTPWFQKIADRMLAPHTDLAIAVSRVDRRVHDARAADARRAHEGGLPRGAAGRVRAAAKRRGDGRGQARRWASNPGTISVGTITRLMPSKGNQHLVDAAPEILRRHPNVRIFIIGEGELAAGAGRRRPRRSGSATAWSSRDSRATSPRRSRRWTSSSFRRCGKARR